MRTEVINWYVHFYKKLRLSLMPALVRSNTGVAEKRHPRHAGYADAGAAVGG